MRLSLPLLAVVVAATVSPAPAQDVIKAVRRTAPPPPETAWREGEVIVGLRSVLDDRAVERVLRGGGAARARASRFSRTFLVDLDAGASVPDAIEAFRRMPEVEFAEPNGIVHKSQARTFTPNDQYYRYQWNMKQIGAERTWGIQRGSARVGVAVLDTGVAYEDYTDPATGRVYGKAPDWGDTPFLPGYDFVNGDDHPNDDEWHGTHVASTIAEAANNSIGLAGLAHQCAIMPVKVLDEFGSGTFFDVAEGIDYATNYMEGDERVVKVINMSLGTDSESTAVRQAVERAHAGGIVVVAAGGNTGEAGIDFPASLPLVIAAGATDVRRGRAVYSSTGPELDLMAPGGDCDRDDDNDGLVDCVFQQMPDPDFVDLDVHTRFCYCGLDGTSMASPHIAAAAALLISQGITHPDAVKAALEQTAERLGGVAEGERNDTYGNGLIRPAAGLSGLGFNQGPID